MKTLIVTAMLAALLLPAIVIAGDGPGDMPGLPPPPPGSCGCPSDVIIAYNKEYVGALTEAGSANILGELTNSATGAGVFFEGKPHGIIIAENEGYVRATLNVGSASIAPGAKVTNAACGACVSVTNPTKGHSGRK